MMPRPRQRLPNNVYADYGDCMIEKFISGRELTVGVLCGKALPVIEIRSKAAFYDYHAKYIADTTEYLFDTIDDAAMIDRLGTGGTGCLQRGRLPRFFPH